MAAWDLRGPRAHLLPGGGGDQGPSHRSRTNGREALTHIFLTPVLAFLKKNSFMGNFPVLEVFDYEGRFLVNGIPISAAYFL